MAHNPSTPLPLPGPARLPLLGHIPTGVRYLRDSLGVAEQLYRDYGPLVGLELPRRPVMFAFGPEYNHLLSTDTAQFRSNPLGGLPVPPGSSVETLNSGLVSMNGEQHRRQRRLMMPAFHRKQVEGYHTDMAAIIRRRLDAWHPGQPIDLLREMQALTLEVALKTLFGLASGPQAVALAQTINRQIATLSSPGVLLFPRDLPGTPFRTALRAADGLVAAFRTLIAQKRASQTPSDDVLAVLIAARDEDGTSMTERELIAQTYTLFFAGHETTSNALTWTLFLLDQHPQIHADLLDELTATLGDSEPSVETLARLPLLDRVVRESLRLLPPVCILVRQAVADCTMGGYAVRAGTLIAFSPYITQRMPSLYDAPKRFRPARWETTESDPYSYLPFGGGPRMCIGSSFALQEIKLVLALLLPRFRLALQPDARIDRHHILTLTPAHGMPMFVNSQDRRFQRSPVRGNIREMVELDA
ncbi:MAG: cytochrome P450 [Roseiflexaceae bacterium]